MTWRTTPLPKGWKQTRRRILTRDNYTCQHCGRHDARHVDHITPASQGGTEDDTNLQTLCGHCHGKKTTQEANAARGPQPTNKRDDEPHPGDIDPDNA